MAADAYPGTRHTHPGRPNNPTTRARGPADYDPADYADQPCAAELGAKGYPRVDGASPRAPAGRCRP
jgi:hypothetical protein